MENQDFKLLISTAPDQATAESLAQQLVLNKIAACVNLVPQVKSIYQWQGKLESESEVLMLIKSSVKNFKAIDKFLKENHPYDVPELISCNIDEVSASYGQWLVSNIENNQ